MTADKNILRKHHQAAQTAMEQGRLREAHQHCLAILKLDQNHADAWFLCAVIAAHNGQVAKSVEILRKAISLDPQRAEYRAELGKQLVALGNAQEALQVAREALALAPTDLPTLNTLGTVLSHAGEHGEAVHCFQQAADRLEARSGNQSRPSATWEADLYFNLATSLNFAGRLAEAEQCYERAIALQPRYFKAHSALSQLRRQTADNNHLQRLQALQKGVNGPQEQLHVGHAIAKEQEDLGQYSKAMASLRWAKAAQAKSVAYRIEDDYLLFDALEALFDKSVFSRQVSGCDNPEPIFIVGMPRTGTTLVEQILASHSRVFAAGELQNFPLQVKRMTGTSSGDVLDQETLEQSLHLDMLQLGESYIASTRPRTGHTAWFIDKLPLNFMYLGLLRLALPQAKLICLRRDPMDTCLSNYRQLFAVNYKYYHYNYDLMDCGRYYQRFDRLMRHWGEVMPGAVHELHYEQLVAEPERVSRELLAFCELPWETQCLDFYSGKASVATPSATQVRQPIYNSSVDRWRRYGDAMQPLYDMLSSAGCYPQGAGPGP